MKMRAAGLILDAYASFVKIRPVRLGLPAVSACRRNVFGVQSVRVALVGGAASVSGCGVFGAKMRLSEGWSGSFFPISAGLFYACRCGIGRWLVSTRKNRALLPVAGK